MYHSIQESTWNALNLQQDNLTLPEKAMLSRVYLQHSAPSLIDHTEPNQLPTIGGGFAHLTVKGQKAWRAG